MPKSSSNISNYAIYENDLQQFLKKNKAVDFYSIQVLVNQKVVTMLNLQKTINLWNYIIKQYLKTKFQHI